MCVETFLNLLLHENDELLLLVQLTGVRAAAEKHDKDKTVDQVHSYFQRCFLGGGAKTPPPHQLKMKEKR